MNSRIGCSGLGIFTLKHSSMAIANEKVPNIVFAQKSRQILFLYNGMRSNTTKREYPIIGNTNIAENTFLKGYDKIALFLICTFVFTLTSKYSKTFSQLFSMLFHT